MNKPPDKKIIEIADFIFANPDKNTTEILSHFVAFCRKNERTVQRYLKEARKYNETRIIKQETEKEMAIIKVAGKQAERQAMTRDEAIQILETIAKGSVKKVPTHQDKEGIFSDYEFVYPSDRERIAAISKLADMQGWDAPKKSEITGNLMSLAVGVIDIRTSEIIQDLFGKEQNNILI